MYEKLERSFELFVPVLRSPARPVMHPYIRELLSLENLSIHLAWEIVKFMKDYAPSMPSIIAFI
jgi:hypothetical protein